MTDFTQARDRMVEHQLRTVSVTDKRLLAAMQSVPRERFLPPARQSLAYSDAVHELSPGRFLASPAPFARLVQLAEIQPDDAVLVVGTGTGYSAAVLSLMAREVTALESDPALADEARRHLTELEYAHVRLIDAPLDGSARLDRKFDAIVLEGAVDAEPSAFFPVLAEGGRLVALLVQRGVATAHVYVRTGDEVAGRAEFNTSLPPLPAAPRSETFVF